MMVVVVVVAMVGVIRLLLYSLRYDNMDVFVVVVVVAAAVVVDEFDSMPSALHNHIHIIFYYHANRIDHQHKISIDIENKKII